jgi:hypothetical protein
MWRGEGNKATTDKEIKERIRGNTIEWAKNAWERNIGGTENHGGAVSTPAVYSGDHGFKPRPGEQLSSYPLPSNEVSGQYRHLKTVHTCFLPHIFQLIIH